MFTKLIGWVLTFLFWAWTTHKMIMTSVSLYIVTSWDIRLQCWRYHRLINTMEQSSCWEVSNSSTSQEIPLMEPERTVFTGVYNLSLFELDEWSWESISLRFTLILLFSHLWSGLPSIFFPSGFNTKKFSAYLISPVCTLCQPISSFMM